MDALRDVDPIETKEWREALDSVLAFEGPDRAQFLLEALTEDAQRHGAPVPYTSNTPYLNTIPPDQEARHPGDRTIEHRIRSLIRWNALATVLRANKESSEVRRRSQQLLRCQGDPVGRLHRPRSCLGGTDGERGQGARN
jgi:pyruvate dehydrogenase E1 component